MPGVPEGGRTGLDLRGCVETCASGPNECLIIISKGYCSTLFKSIIRTMLLRPDVVEGVVWVPTLKNVGARLTAETTRRVHHSSWEAALLHLW